MAYAYMYINLNPLHSDVVAVKGSFFTVENTTVTSIFQRDLLCRGNEDSLLNCPYMMYEEGARDCPLDHSEDAGVKCNGTLYNYIHI